MNVPSRLDVPAPLVAMTVGSADGSEKEGTASNIRLPIKKKERK